MEPLRGGRLVELLPEKARALMERHTPRRSPARVGAALAVESARSDLCAFRHEQS